MIYIYPSSRRIGEGYAYHRTSDRRQRSCPPLSSALLDSDPEIGVVGEATNFQQTIQTATDLKPQIIVMDLHMADDSSVNAQEIKSLLNTLGSRLIAISFWDDEGTRALAKSFGAVTLLDKFTLATTLIPAIKAATLMQRSASV